MTNHTPIRTLRVDDELWQRVQRASQRDGVSASDVMRDALLAYVMSSEARARRAAAEKAAQTR